MLKSIAFLIAACLFLLPAHAQQFNPGDIPADSWAKTFENKKGTVSALWYDIDPFIYKDKRGNIMGVEYELMEAFGKFVRDNYQVDLTIKWINAGSFENIYPYIKAAKKPGIFGWSYYSITPERSREVSFSPPYMPDLNVVVTNNEMPYFSSNNEFIKDLSGMKAFTMKSTTMEDDMNTLKTNFDPALVVSNKLDDYKVLEEIAGRPNAFGYVPLSIYVTALQKGIRVKRQKVMAVKRPGYAAILPMNSDWQIPLTAYFKTEGAKKTARDVIKKYLGSEESDLIFSVSENDSLQKTNSDVEFLTLEKEIVTKRLVESAVQIQKERNLRSIMITAGAAIIIVLFFVYRRIREKKKVNELLLQRNETILRQNAELALINNRLQLKILQSRLSPHFIFNSLNALQYFIGLNDRKAALHYLSAFSKFLRQLLNNANATTNSATNEIDMLTQYLDLEKQRFQNRFDFEIKTEGHYTLSEASVPSLLLHSIAENALYHGILNRENGNGMIRLHFNKENNFLKISIEDNGVGREKSRQINQQKNVEGLTMQSSPVKERIGLLNKNAADKIIYHIEDLKDDTGKTTGTRVELFIPLSFGQEVFLN